MSTMDFLLEPIELGTDLDDLIRPEGYIICDAGYLCDSGKIDK